MVQGGIREEDAHVAVAHGAAAAGVVADVPSSRTPVFFGGMTALQIARAARVGRRDFPDASMRSLPAQAPKLQEVSAAVGQVESMFPGLRLDRPVHVLVGGTARVRRSAMCVSHCCSVRLPRRSFVKLAPQVYASKPELAFVQVAGLEKDQVRLLLLGYELCGGYATARTRGALSQGMPSYQVEALATVRGLGSYAARIPSLNGAGKVNRAARYLADDSASPRETQLALALGLPQRFGGGGLGIPAMNYRIEATEEARDLAGRSFFLADLCWPEAKVDVEYQSAEMHGNSESLDRDSLRTNALDLMKWHVKSVANIQLGTMKGTDGVIKEVGKALGKDMRVHVDDYQARKLELRRRLGLPCGREEWL